MQTKLVPIGNVKQNPKNPRIIKNEKFNKLVQSIQEFPKMLQLRPIVVDENNVVLGGNMRLKACKEAGLKEVYIIEAKELTPAEQQQFIIKDNVSFGDWDWENLANEWDADDLISWGLDLDIFDKIDNAQEGDDIEIEKSLQVLPKKEYIIIMADEDSAEWEELKTIFKCGTVRQGGCKIGSTSDKVTTGMERVFNLKTFKERVLNEL